MDNLEYENALLQFRGTIRTFARNCVHQLPGYDIEDIEQELRVVLWKCVNKFDPSRRTKLSTLFMGCARNHVITMVRAAGAKKRTALVYSMDGDAAIATWADTMRTEGSAEDWYMAYADHGKQLNGVSLSIHNEQVGTTNG